MLSAFTCLIADPHPASKHLIVGAGLAGCLLGWRLQQAGESFQLIGSSKLPAAFAVAAGIINPVTGRWMTKSWKIDQLLPAAEKTYLAIERQFGLQFYHRIPEIRFCQNTEDVKRVGRRIRNPRYQNVIGAFHPAGTSTPEFDNPHGAFQIKQAAYVDLAELVHALRNHFSQLGLFHDQIFQHSELKRNGVAWKYREISTQNVIFCEGAAASDNPWFSQVPLKPAKGETLLCQSSTLKLPQQLYHHKKWLLPYSDGSFRIGATYDEQDLSDSPTASKKEELLSAIKASLKHPHHIEIKAHLVGIRPSSSDSRPVIGAHPEEPGLYILNGLGSKGASTAPTMTAQLVQHILNALPINPEVDIARFS